MPISSSSRLFVVSYLLLFSEIMAIRWLTAELAIFRAFPNLILMVVFISTSVSILSRHKKQASLGLIGFCCLSTIGLALGSRWLDVYHAGLSADTCLKGFVVIGFVTANLSIIFSAIGRTLGLEFERMPGLRAYSVNLLGSLLGTISFSVFSFFYTSPAIWLAICAGLIYYLYRKNSVWLMALAVILPTAFIYRDAVWSPYGKIEISADQDFNPLPGNYVLNCNNDFFHRALHLKPATGELITSWSQIAEMYKGKTDYFRKYIIPLEIPYTIKRQPRNVLVLGAGSGNDVEFALSNGAQRVDAIEINPVIANCGFNRHPDRPYLDRRVHVYKEDARTFLRYTKQKYDLIQFTFLDPGSTLRTNPFLRTDNFVYTRECIKSCLNHLDPGGVVSLSFATDSTCPATIRLYSTIMAATGTKPLCWVQDGLPSCLFVFGNECQQGLLPAGIMKEAGLRNWPNSGEYEETRPATDDWPFLYLEFKSAGAIALYFFVLLSATLCPLWMNRKNFEANIFSPASLSMFLLGLAFMLMETKSITQLSLLFGSTWIVTAVVVLVFIMLAFLANLFVSSRRSQNLLPIYIGLAVSFLVNLLLWRVPESSNVHPFVFAGMTAIISCLPVLFGGMMFSTLLKKYEGQSTNLLGANLLGTAFGGLLEYICIFAGLKSLTIIALLIYVLAIVALNFPKIIRSS